MLLTTNLDDPFTKNRKRGKLNGANEDASKTKRLRTLRSTPKFTPKSSLLDKIIGDESIDISADDSDTDARFHTTAVSSYSPYDRFISDRASFDSSSSVTSSYHIDECIKIKESCVVLPEALSTVDNKDVLGFLSDLGFVKPPKVTISRDNMVFLDFYHSHVAHAAYSILRHRASDLWKTRDPAEALIDNRAPGVNKTFSRCEIVDLTGVDDDMDKRNAGGNFHGSKTQGRKESRDSGSSGRCLPLFLHDPIHLQSTEPVIGSSGIRTSACSSSRPILPEPNGGPLEIRDMSNFRTRSLDARASSPRRHEKIIDVDIYTVNVPKAPFNRARRILISEDTELPIATVSMRADIQFFNRKERHRISKMSLSNDSIYRHTVDAKVMIDNTAVIGFGDGPCQIALVRLDNTKGSPPSLTELNDAPHKTSGSGSTKGREAVSCLVVKGTHFITGGYDKNLIFWSTIERSTSAATTKILSLTTIPEALAVRNTNLLVGGSQKILQIDLAHLETKPIVNQLSNTVYQIHNQAPEVTILEVNSMDFQVQIFDLRKRGFNRAADCSFGARNVGCSSRANTTRYSRGDTVNNLFVRGYEDGTVILWDFRNLKKPLIAQKYADMGSIVHTVFAGPDVVCYGEKGLTFVKRVPMI